MSNTSSSGQTTSPKKPPKTITRRRGACKGCNGGTPCSACDRTGSTCNYEPRPRKASEAREPTPGKPQTWNRPEHDRDRPPNEDLGNANEPQTLSLAGSSPAMFSLDPNMDFLFSSGTFSFPNPSEGMGVIQAAPPPPSEYQSVSGTQYPVTYSTISPTSPLGTSEFETGRSTTADSIGALSSPWPTLDRRTTQVTDHSLPEYCRTDADIDFRFNTSFGLAELPAPPRDSRKHLEICRILRNLTKSQSPTSNPKDSSVQSGPSLSKTTPEVTIQPCVKACFKSNTEIPMFLRTTDVVKRIFEVRESPHPDALSLLFSDAIIAMGLDGMRDPVDERRGSSVDGSEHYRSILDAAVDFHAVPNSFLKLQSIIASNKNDSRLSEILSIGVHCARELRFTNSNSIRKVFMHADDQKLAKRTVWVLYCLETSFSVTRGIPPIAAAALLARSFSRVYVRPVSAKTTTELQASTSELARWRYCLPDHAKQLVVGQGFQSLRGDDDAGAKLRLFCSYHECVYLLFGPWLPPLLESMSPPQGTPARDSDVMSNAEAGAGSATDCVYAA
ncbi:hypothetical protein FHL15_001201 [Xylaria flabelliformis]|uniref:Transcription factor domain-containing protein n=1 Tax=Xylaria flabelliformis TaxID=2512241 RepID=A0A553ICS2_9PEZI|nr:hypothetical protein FHL15_001201 [Xylaria flabelliformis]